MTKQRRSTARSKGSSKAAATQQDIGSLMAQIGDLYRANERWKEEIKEHVEQRMQVSEERMKDHFAVIVEDFRHNLLSAKHDSIELLKDRVTRLERHTGLARAA